MLTKLYLQNFRCFDKHTLELRPMSIIVGANNAGKSTTIEALRIFSLIVNRYGSLNFSSVPEWLSASDMSVVNRGVAPSLKGIDFNTLSIFHNLGTPPALIRATFEEGFTVEIYIGPNAAIHAVIKGQDNQPISDKSKAQKALLPKVSILPQVTPVTAEEYILDPDYARAVTSSSWASLHFRNQLNLYPEYFDDFKKLAESTWPNLRILGLEKENNNPGEQIALFVQDHEFVAEIAWMGHGLQMWLQTMWFLARSKDSPTVILDEPDVYMHADLQRKLIRLLKGRHHQVIVATHSVEIMAEVDAQDVLIINRMANKSVYAASIPSVQKVIDNIGGVHNLQLARLWGSHRCLFVEGKDITFLKALQNHIFPKSREAIDTIPNMQLGGWGGWNYALGSKLLLKNAVGESIMTYCIFDSDYHTSEEIQERYKQAKDRSVELHIWKKKEIENYFIVPDAIQRIIATNLRNCNSAPTADEISEQIDIIANDQKDSTFDAISAEFFTRNKGGGTTDANKKARKQIDNAWATQDGRWSIVSGKIIISSLSGWSQQCFGIALNPLRILKEMNRYMIEAEMINVITAIERSLPFS